MQRVLTGPCIRATVFFRGRPEEVIKVGTGGSWEDYNGLLTLYRPSSGIPTGKKPIWIGRPEAYIIDDVPRRVKGVI